MSAQDSYQASVAAATAGHLDDALALARQAAEAKPTWARGHGQVGAVLAALGRFDEAAGPLERSLALEPDQPEALNNLGAVRRGQGDAEAAIAAYRRAVALAPDYLAANRNLAGTLCTLGRYDEARALMERVVAAGSATAAIYDELGKARWRAGDIPGGIADFRRALDLDDGYADAWAHLGNAFIEDGRIAEAVSSFKKAIAIEPSRGEFYRFLGDADANAITDEQVAAVIALADAGPNEGTAEVHYALGKIYASRGDRPRSFPHLQIANTAARAKLEYDEAAMLTSFEQIASTFDAPYLQARSGTGFESDLPIFIFGMPRSGTTLIEQILASHPAVRAGGELSLFDDIATEMLGAGAASVREIGERYVTELAKLAPVSVLRLTDKMPANFRFAGLIHLALPNARMIHARRDPLETCLSCYGNSFAASGLAWTCDLGELGRYCRGYLQLMEHWRTTFPPDTMLEVQYEEVVDDLEGQARRMVAYCGLPWDDRCLDFYQTKRPVKTASAAQVRKPIYRSSLRTADAYGDALRPLIDALG
jgi:tetratricopeptide (TPR) repeat protein